ncbi:lysophospholipase [Ascosphaera apis ARSEF 7405]|uniref:Lysophospholipase n=1 Tax=Ascosphaera apis ARSEF 7405 TaxID=392613 RepID=A0A162I7V3_9EURO|nr:lysophospholipase [Ascosphaera apis ARSEF 7405]
MRVDLGTLLLTAAAGVVSAPTSDSTDLVAFDARALPNAPDGYAPKAVKCPSNRPSIRSGLKLSENESKWLDKRRSKATDSLRSFLDRVKIDGFDATKYIDSHKNNKSAIPNVAIAASGGGYRAMLNGAGALSAFDDRTPNATSKGQLGGLLQSATYVAGLSGGSWLVGSVFLNNFTAIHDLQRSEDVWDLSRTILQGPTDHSFFLLTFKDNVEYLYHLKKQIDTKRDANFSLALTDLWGRALAYQMINDTTGQGGLDFTWSSIAEMDNFKNGETPMPLVVADSRNPNETLVTGNSTVFEFNPWEFGTFDPTILGFIPLEYLGSKFNAGELPDNESCIRGFDNAGYVMGTSATLFNAFAQNIGRLGVGKKTEDALKSILEAFDEAQDDIAPYKPNPFYHYANKTNPFADHEQLTMVDGGEDGQNIPLHPLIQPERHVDVIFAVDSSADTDHSWPNGTAMIAAYERTTNEKFISNGTAFPAVPDSDTFVNNGLNQRPTFFGCDVKNQSSITPLIVYLPNAPVTYLSNASTFDLKYEDDRRDDIILNGYNVATRGNGTLDSNWGQCVSCAILSRSFARTNTNVPDACKQCFQKYCWDGKTNTTKPSEYSPDVMIQTAADNGATKMGMSVFGLVAGVLALLPTLM